jgi:aminoglycoside phosphotransferase (APT) family kinase protein
MFADAGRWSLATLPDNPGLARKAGELLRRVHETTPAAMSNLSHGMDQEWIAVDFVSTFRRLERYRGKLQIPAATLEAARATRPPAASDPKAAHANPKPSRVIVDDLGAVTLINWEWATLAPPEWDLTRLGWLLRLEAGTAASDALLEGYGSTIARVQLARWAVYHTGMMLVSEAEETVRSGGADFSSLSAQLDEAIAIANTE